MKESTRTRGMDRALEILDYLRDRRVPLRPNEVAVGIGAPRSTAYELINLLLKAGMLEYADKEGRVYLGRKLYFLGLAYEAQFDLMRECKAYLDRLSNETRETAQLCMLDGNKYTVAMMHEGIRPFRISSSIGDKTPIPWTASGRLLVSHLSDEEIVALIPDGDFELPSGERLDPARFIAEARQAAGEGFFSFETLTDNFTRCFAAPVHRDSGECIATLCLIAPRGDAQRNYEQYRQALISAAGELSEKLGSNRLRITRIDAA